MFSFVTFILEDPKYYNLSKKEVGEELGYIGMVAEACVMVLELFIGIIIDAFGRKIPVITGLTVAGICLILVPIASTLYPSFLILRCLIGMGTIISINIPLLPDYVHKESLGMASAYSSNAINVVNLITNFLLLDLV